MKLGNAKFTILKGLVRGKKLVQTPTGGFRWTDHTSDELVPSYIVQWLIARQILARTSGGDIFITVPGMMVFEAEKAKR